MTSKLNSEDEKKAIVFAACEALLVDKTPASKITGRMVAKSNGITWSHTTVTPFVNLWHKQRNERERDAIKQIQMSPLFVKALLSEVEDRVAKLRDLDSDEMARMQEELTDANDENRRIELAAIDTMDKLAQKTQDATQSSLLAKQLKESKEEVEEHHKIKLDELQSEIKELKATIEKNNANHANALVELRAEHRTEMEKLGDKKDALQLDLQHKTTEAAEYKIKSDRFDTLSKDLDAANTRVNLLTSENIQLKADVETRQSALNSATQMIDDCKTQRDKAQNRADKLEVDFNKLKDSHNDILVKVASAGITLYKDEVAAPVKN